MDVKLYLCNASGAVSAAVLAYSDDRAAMRAYLSATDALDKSIERSTADGVLVVPVTPIPPAPPPAPHKSATAFGRQVAAREHGTGE